MPALPFHPGSLVGGYFRDSGGDNQDLSVPRQISNFLSWCSENNLVPGRIFKDEARPGSSIVSRTGFQEMIAYFRAGAPEKGLCIWNWKRFARDVDDAQYYRADIRRMGYIFYSLSDEIPDGPMGRLWEAYLDVEGEKYLQDLSVEAKDGLRYIVDKYGAVPGTPPAGFKREPVHVSDRRTGKPRILHRWVPDPERIPLVRRAWELKAAGESVPKIHAETHLYNSLNSYTTFYTNKLYLGILEFGDLVVENYCEPIIDKELWDQVQAIVKRHARHRNLDGKDPAHPRRQNSSYLLSGLVFCGKCGAPLFGLSVKQPDGTYYERYACTRAKRRRDCDAEAIPRIFLDNTILETLREFVLQPETQQAHQEYIINNQANHLAKIEKNRADLRTLLGGIRRKVKNVTNAIAETGHTRALLDKLSQLEAEETEILSALFDLDRKLSAVPPALNPEEIMKNTDRLKALLASQDPNTLRTILRGITEKIIVERTGKTCRIYLSYYYPPESHPNKSPPDNGNTMSSSRIPLGAPKNSRFESGCCALTNQVLHLR